MGKKNQLFLIKYFRFKPEIVKADKAKGKSQLEVCGAQTKTAFSTPAGISPTSFQPIIFKNNLLTIFFISKKIRFKTY